MLTIEMLRQLWPHGDLKVPGLVEGIAAQAPGVFPRYGLATDLTIAHAMAQFSQECGAGTAMVENLHYSAQGLLKIWPKRFTAATAQQFAQLGPEAIANFVYDGRNGNAIFPSGDGWNFRGRGLQKRTT